MHFYVTWNGYLAPCCAKPFPKEQHFGNVFKDGLMKCLNSSAYRNQRKMWFENKTPKACEGCGCVDLKPIDIKQKVAFN
jgi:radical SAM protein with 4Fe4S-binding SPASM domain